MGGNCSLPFDTERARQKKLNRLYHKWNRYSRGFPEITFQMLADDGAMAEEFYTEYLRKYDSTDDDGCVFLVPTSREGKTFSVHCHVIFVGIEMKLKSNPRLREEIGYYIAGRSSSWVNKDDYPGIDAFVYVVNCADVDGVEESLNELNMLILQNEAVWGKDVMVLADNQSVEGAVGSEQIEYKIREKYCFAEGVHLLVMPCDRSTQEGVQAAFDTLKILAKTRKGLPTVNHHYIDDDDDDDDKINNDTREEMKKSLFKNPAGFLRSLMLF